MSRGPGPGVLSRRFGTGPAAGRARPGKRPGLLDRADAQSEKTSNIDVMRARLKKINSRLEKLHNPAGTTSRPASSASAPAYMSRPSTSGSRPSTSGSLWVDYGSLSHHGADPLHFKQEVRRRALAWIAAEERIFRTIVSDNYTQLVKTEIAIIKEDMGKGKFAKSKGNSGYSFEELVAKLARHRVSRKISLELERRKLDEWNLPQVMKCVSKEYMAGIRQRAKEMGEDMAGQSDLLSLSSSIPLSSARKRGARDRRKSVVQQFLEQEQRERRPTLQAQDSIVEEVSQVALGEEEGEDLLLSPTSNVTPGSIMEKVLEWTPSVKKKQSLRQGQQWELPLKPRAGETPGDMYVRTCELEGMPPTPQVREQLNRAKWKFTNMALGPEGVSSLVCVTQAAQQLTHLDLSNSMADDLPCAMLVSQLDLQRVPLETLLLGSNFLGIETCHALGFALARPVKPHSLLSSTSTHLSMTLQTLDLSDNALGNDGVGVLMRSLSGNTTLKQLRLVRTGLTRSFTNHFAAAFRENRSLEHLDLSWNSVGAGGAVGLSKLVQGPHALKSLGLSFIDIDQQGMKNLCVALGKRLEQGTALANLTLDGCGTEEMGWMSLACLVRRLDADGRPFALSLKQNNLGGVPGQCLCRTLQGAGNVFYDLESCTYAQTSYKQYNTAGLLGANGAAFALDLADEEDRRMVAVLLEQERASAEKGFTAWADIVLDGVSMRQEGRNTAYYDRAIDAWAAGNLPHHGKLEVNVCMYLTEERPQGRVAIYSPRRGVRPGAGASFRSP